MTSKYLIKEQAVTPYSPANHHETTNRRLIGADNVGAKHLEVVLGTIARGGGALPHAHPGLEQVCYLLTGTAQVEIDGESFEMHAGDTCFFPANSMHVFSVTSTEPARVLVVYGPPYAEHPDRVRR